MFLGTICEDKNKIFQIELFFVSIIKYLLGVFLPAYHRGAGVIETRRRSPMTTGTFRMKAAFDSGFSVISFVFVEVRVFVQPQAEYTTLKKKC